MTRSAWRGRDDAVECECEGGGGDGEGENTRARVDRMLPLDDPSLSERGRERVRLGFWGVRWGDGGLMELVVRMVWVREEILAARRASCSWFSVWVWVQRHAQPWMWMLGREFWGLSNARHSVCRSRFGRAGARGVHDTRLEGSSWMVNEVRVARGGPTLEWCRTERVLISAIFSAPSLRIAGHLTESDLFLGSDLRLIRVKIGTRDSPTLLTLTTAYFVLDNLSHRRSAWHASAIGLARAGTRRLGQLPAS